MLSLKRLLQLILIGFILGIAAIGGAYLYVKEDLPSVAMLQDVQLQTPMQIFSQDGKLISQFGEKKRIPLSLEQMPQTMIDAILATEDNRFYQHFGIDPVGIMRAVFGKIIGQNKGGGSTITMQVARNFFLTREQTYIRKIKEIFISLHIESLLTKDEILALYLNKIELGHRSFGVGAAAQTYYGKDLNELNLAQIAVIAGLPKAPSTLNPISSPQRAKERRSVVLQRMLVSGYITETQYREANNSPITGKRHGADIELSAPYVAEMAHQKMLELYGSEVAYTSGFKVYTTVPSHLQVAAQNAIFQNSHDYDERHGFRGAIKSLWPASENVVSLTAQETLDVAVELENTDATNAEALTTEPMTVDTDAKAILLMEELVHPNWTVAKIFEELAELPSLGKLTPALVAQVNKQSVNILVKGNIQAQISWDNLKWARTFVDDEHQGVAPEKASDILNAGELIWVRLTEDNQYRLTQIPQVSSAIVAISPDNGAILSTVGGYSFLQSQFNRATQAKRQVGSNIKPFIYSAALSSGYTLASIINDAPINQWDRRSGFAWRPKNSPEKYDGPIRVRNALAQSKNVVSVRLLRAVGLTKMRYHLAKFGFDLDELPKNEALALGSASLTPMEVATGIAAFANGGFLVEPYIIERIEDNEGNIIYQANPAIACDSCDQAETTFTPEGELITIPSTVKKAERIISAQNAFLITQAMNSAIWASGGSWQDGTGWNGTGWRARSLKRRDIAGKTGTTNEAKDAWFSGYSRNIVATSWIGFDDHTRNLGKTSPNRNMTRDQITGSEFGAKSAQPAWIKFMETALADQPITPFKPPENIISVRIDKASGKLTRQTDRSSIFEFFDMGTEPSQYVSKDIATEVLDGSNSQTDDIEEAEIF